VVTRRAVNIDELRSLAERRLPRMAFEYLDGGAEDESTVRRNREVRAHRLPLGKGYLHHGSTKLGVKKRTRLRNGFYGKKAQAPPKKLKPNEEFSGLD
jgi:isopentenyl diphosphate isomerase/L-lactate dehydrogenase-like FMN-dependent dehydrogenase